MQHKLARVVLSCSWTVLATAAAVAQPVDTTSGDGRYLKPPAEVVAILDAPPPPTAALSPARDVVALAERVSMPPIAELAQPMLRLAGLRVNPATNGPHRTPGVTAVTLKRLDGTGERRLEVPGSSALTTIGFSPDGKRYALAAFGPDRLTLWIADVAAGTPREVTGLSLNGVFPGAPCDWSRDSRQLVCLAVPAKRAAVPVAPRVPAGPNAQQVSGRPAPVRTYQDLLTTSHDEALFEYHGSSEVALVDAASRTVTRVGSAGIYPSVTPSPNGEYLLVRRITRPFSRLVPYDDFPERVEVWSKAGALVKTLAELPLGDNVPMNGVRTGPRSLEWVPTAPATVTWVEALDRGDPKVKVPHRDRVLSLAAPFTGEPADVARTEWRFRGLDYTDTGVGLLTETDRPSRKLRVWLLEAGAAPRKLQERSSEDRYGDPGTPVRRPGAGTILQAGTAIYLSGQGASPAGDRPFLDRLDLATLKAERLFHCDTSSYETLVGLLDDEGGRLLTRRETRTDPPNVFVRDRAKGTLARLTAYQHPAAGLNGVTRQLLTYERPDGVKLSASLYLPASHKAGERLPVMVWAYPREFTDPGAAGQVAGSPNRFPAINGASHLLFLTQGYAVLDDPTMPIVGPGETANDTYVEQLVASAKAAIDKVVSMGVADPERIGVGGHSYGAFMTANLLAHSDLFRAGIARSGAYNRTLTPFGFQSENRTFWEVPDLYAKMSPFWYAHKVNEPILLLHGEADNNTGTFPIQSERFYMALKGHGATVRYVTLPFEAHGYAARESVLHTVAEMLNWADTYVKRAGPRATATATPNQ
jgi:dipeptidyl aminopeptidase/acylaminoacyl peptidase